MAPRRRNEDEESIISEDETADCHPFEILEVTVLFVLHVADLIIDFILIIDYFRNKNLQVGFAILGIVYASSFFSAIFERKSKAASDPEPENSFLFYFWGFLMFIFNFSGTLMFSQALYKLCRYTKTTNHELEIMQQNLVYLKTIEGFVESLPQLYVQFVLLRTDAMKLAANPRGLTNVKLYLAYIGLVYTIIHYASHVTPNITGIFNKIFRTLWLLFMSVSWVSIVICIMIFFVTNKSSTPMILYMHILFTGCVCVSFNLSRKPVVMIVLSFFCLSQYFFPDEYRDSDAEKDRFLVISHILHFIEMGIITAVWFITYHHLTIEHTAYAYLITIKPTIFLILGCYILGEFFFIIFQMRLKNSKTLEVRRINSIRSSRQERRVSLISLRPLNHSFQEDTQV